MQLIEKREKDMSLDEKVKLELLRTIAASKGYNLRDASSDFDFSKSGRSYKIVEFITNRFNVSFKNKEEEKIYWPEKDVIYKNKEIKNEKVDIIDNVDSINEAKEGLNDVKESKAKNKKEKE